MSATAAPSVEERFSLLFEDSMGESPLKPEERSALKHLAWQWYSLGRRDVAHEAAASLLSLSREYSTQSDPFLMGR